MRSFWAGSSPYCTSSTRATSREGFCSWVKVSMTALQPSNPSFSNDWKPWAFNCSNNPDTAASSGISLLLF
jgi:hypothetical protein